MSNNDVINYSIGINEYLYKSGFKDIYAVDLYSGSGEITTNAITIPLSNVTKYFSITDLDSQLDGIKVSYIEKYNTCTIIIFGANEPNYNVDVLHDNYLINGSLPKRVITIVVSDYNHSRMHNELKQYSNINVVYFFFQGYLAIQWYRQYKMYKPFTDTNFEFKYSSMSRINSKMRAYRLYITSKLSEYNLLDQGQVSCSYVCPASNETVPEILEDRYCFLNKHQQNHVQEHLVHKLPLRFDKFEHDVIPNTSFEIDLIEMSKSFLHIVNETVFYEKFNHLTEKTFKPIVAMRPFMLCSTQGSLAYLKRYGFKSFDRWIDESYDQEPDQHKRLDMIVNEVRKICELPMDEISRIYEEMLPVLEHNYNLFYGSFEQDILDELVLNYSNAI